RNEAELFDQLIPKDPLPDMRGRTPEDEFNALTPEQKILYAKEAEQLIGFATGARAAEFSHGFEALEAKWGTEQPELQSKLDRYVELQKELDPLDQQLAYLKSQIKDQANWTLRAELDATHSDAQFKQFLLKNQGELSYISEVPQALKGLDRAAELRTETSA